MMHVSIPVENTVQFINVTEVSPLISSCEIKVCYIGENRNKTFISKEVAAEMGKKLPGSPIVGYYNQETEDFEQHNREIEIEDEKFAIIDTTKAYGFVPTDAKVWFQKFVDDGEVEREYLVTEGYIWTDIYPESKRIVEQGNNQSMELNKNSVKGHWSGNLNSDNRFFIISEAIIEKLCILGEDFEPCFEGSQVKSHFSLETEFAEFKNTMFAMINELKQAFNEGGSNTSMNEVDKIQEPVVVEEPIAEVEVPVVEEPVTPVVEEPVIEEPVVEEPTAAEEFAKKDKKEEDSEDKSDEDDSDKSDNNSEEDDEEEDKKKKYNLDEVIEYVELKSQYEELENKFSSLEQTHNELLAEIEPLKAFKLAKEREDKQAMIDSFYMLSEEDKADVVTNIDSYSLNDIEAKLAVICVRNKVSFSLEEDDTPGAMSFNLNGGTEDFSDTPAWIKAVKEVASSMQ